jgi:hypothetical protein
MPHDQAALGRPEEVIRQKEKRHQKRMTATAATYRKQGLRLPDVIGAFNLTKYRQASPWKGRPSILEN